MPVGSVSNERRFHLMNLIKTPLRNRLQDKHLNTCVRIAASKAYISYKEMDYARVHKHWKRLKARYCDE
jgi:hypothetical protein